MKPAKIFKNAIEALPPASPGAASSRASPPEPRQVTGLSFDDRGDTVLTAAEDETFRLYSCKTGKQVHSGCSSFRTFRLTVLTDRSKRSIRRNMA